MKRPLSKMVFNTDPLQLVNFPVALLDGSENLHVDYGFYIEEEIKPIGIARIYLASHINIACWYIASIKIEEKYRGRGYGTVFMKLLLSELASQLNISFMINLDLTELKALANYKRIDTWLRRFGFESDFDTFGYEEGKGVLWKNKITF